MLNTLRVVRVKNFKQCRRCTGVCTIVITFFSLLFFLIFFNLFFFSIFFNFFAHENYEMPNEEIDTKKSSKGETVYRVFTTDF